MSGSSTALNERRRGLTLRLNQKMEARHRETFNGGLSLENSLVELHVEAIEVQPPESHRRDQYGNEMGMYPDFFAHQYEFAMFNSLRKCLAPVIVTGMTIAVPARQVDFDVVPIFVDYEAPPNDLGTFMAKTDAIAVVRVAGVTYRSAPDHSIVKARDLTLYRLTIVEPVKLHPMLPSAGAELTLKRLGGQHIDNGRVVRSVVQGFEEFRPDDEYVVFIDWNPTTSEFDIAHGPDGVYQLPRSAGPVRSLGHFSLAKQLDGMDRVEFLNHLRGRRPAN